MNNIAYMHKVQNRVYKYFKDMFTTDKTKLINEFKTLSDMETIKVLGFIQSKDETMYRELSKLIYGGNKDV